MALDHRTASYRMRKVMQLKYRGISPRNREGRRREDSATFSLGRSLSSPPLSVPSILFFPAMNPGRQAIAKEGMGKGEDGDISDGAESLN